MSISAPETLKRASLFTALASRPLRGQSFIGRSEQVSAPMNAYIYVITMVSRRRTSDSACNYVQFHLCLCVSHRSTVVLHLDEGRHMRVNVNYKVSPTIHGLTFHER